MTNSENPEILVVDQTNINLELINDIFSRHQIIANFDLTQSVPGLLAKLEENIWQVILLVIDDIPISIDALIDAMPEINKNCPIIVICQDYDREVALSQIQAGATDVFSLDEIEHLANLTKQLLSNRQLNDTIENQNQALKESHERFIALSNQVPVSIAYVHDGAFINTNPAFQSFFNIDGEDEISEVSLLDLIANDDINKTKAALQQLSKDSASEIIDQKANNLRKNQSSAQSIRLESINVKKSADTLYPVNLLMSQTTVNGESGLQIIFQPSEWNIKPSASVIEHNQLLSPEFFVQSLNQIIRNKNKKHAYCLSFFELNDYSRIKNRIGITRSDHLLHEINDFMKSHASAEFKISRLNSDVYTLLITTESASSCIEKIRSLQTEISNHSFSSIDQKINVSCNIGIVHITDVVHTPDQALSLADVACTVSRNRKQNQLHIYNPEEDRSTVESVDQNWVDKIKDALKHDNFKLLYQPIVSLGAEKEKLFEVLLRIKSSGDVDTLPGQFLHFAHQSQLESSIDKWVIKQAVQTIEKNQKEPIRLFINLSESSLRDISFIEWLQDNYDTQIINLVFEIPEHVAQKWPSETLHFIQQVKSLNGAVCIDQFGNHPDSEALIYSLHADYHKIDGAFVSNLSTNRKHQSIIHNICLNAEETETNIIATYVQDADSLAILWREGIDFIQGNYLQPPAAHIDYKFESQI